MATMSTVAERLQSWPRERIAELLSAACYGTVLVLVALPLIDTDEVSSGLGWELVTGVGVATWVAHLYAEVVGDHLRHGPPLGRAEITRPWSTACRSCSPRCFRGPCCSSGEWTFSSPVPHCGPPSLSASSSWLASVASSALRFHLAAAVGVVVRGRDCGRWDRRCHPQAGSRSLTAVAGLLTPTTAVGTKSGSVGPSDHARREGPKRSMSSPCRRPRSLTVIVSWPSFSMTVRTMHAPARITSARLGWSPTIERRPSASRDR